MNFEIKFRLSAWVIILNIALSFLITIVLSATYFIFDRFSNTDLFLFIILYILIQGAVQIIFFMGFLNLAKVSKNKLLEYTTTTIIVLQALLTLTAINITRLFFTGYMSNHVEEIMSNQGIVITIISIISLIHK